jgi:hypothetical protein
MYIIKYTGEVEHTESCLSIQEPGGGWGGGRWHDGMMK